MTVATFTGNFVKPAEAFTLQHFDYSGLNRLAPELFLWMIILVGAFFVIHFVFSVFIKSKRKA